MSKYITIKQKFEENKNQEQAISMKKYMRNLFDFYGIQTPKRKAIYKDFLKEEKKNKKIDWNFLDECYNDSHREFQYLVYDYLLALNDYLTYDDIPKIKKYAKTKQWWDTIDFLDKVIGNIGLKDKKVDDLMLKWSKDEDFWLRRLAIDHQLGRDEFFINKAIGWSLRDYSKTNPKWVKDFIQKHKDQMNKLSIKEASKYI